jgi:hypothetical protein
MDKGQHQTEKRAVDDRRERRDALGNPEHFYPRPQDVLDDDSLSPDEKRAVLDNWLVALEDRAGAAGTAATMDDDAGIRQAIDSARRQLG